jgi:Zn-finger nucleic acid-binding protein
MNCPICKTVSLVMSERQGIEIDYCPQCRGVWLDRGELDKIIDRSATMPSSAKAEPGPAPYQSYPGPSHHPGSHHGGHYRKKKREGFLSELFDFD